MAQGFSLADQIFNADSLRDLADEFAAGVPGFNADAFHNKVMAGLAPLGFMERMEFIADCLEPQLASDFPTMADQLEAAMVPPLDPTLKDDDFGRFIHTAPGILAGRHGLEDHRDRALDLLYQATQRFSMEFYIRPFINRWPEETWARLKTWATDENYHVRRLVSEGTRPKLPWAKKIDIPQDAPIELLDMLHADPTRFVSRSVSNHLNDIAKAHPDLVVETLKKWHSEKRQNAKELAWMTRHSLRTLVKQGFAPALELLGYRADAPVALEALSVANDDLAFGETLEFDLTLSATEKSPVIVDYQIWFMRKNKEQSAKVFKLKSSVVQPGKPLTLSKKHVLKANATTFTLYPGAHRIAIQVNGKVLGEASFQLREA